MKRLNRSLALWALAGASAFALIGAVAHAQSTAPSATAEEPTAETAIDDRVIVPKRSDKTAPGTPASKAPAPPDWEGVRSTLKEMKARDESYDRQIRAMEQTRQVSAAERERLRPKGLRTAAAEQFQLVAVEEVKRTRVPLLAPVTAETVSSMRVVATDNAYTALGDLPDGASFELVGTRMRVVGGTAGVMRLRMAQRKEAMARIESIDAPYVISRHEQGVDLSFSKFNCAYMITIYCPKPDSDARCANDDFVRSLADNLSILNEAEGGTP